jgi:high-affinity iron transporter
MISRLAVACVLLVANLAFVPAVRADTTSVLTIWRLLDYVAIDYREAVRDGAELVFATRP